MQVCRANDRTLVALEEYRSDASSGYTFWISNDGRTWKSPAAPSGLSTYLLTDGQHGLLAYDPQDPGVADAPSSNSSISMVTDDGGLVALAQEGDRPPYNWKEQWAVGPTDGWQSTLGRTSGVRLAANDARYLASAELGCPAAAPGLTRPDLRRMGGAV
jgi:hypothetical protein